MLYVLCAYNHLHISGITSTEGYTFPMCLLHMLTGNQHKMTFKNYFKPSILSRVLLTYHHSYFHTIHVGNLTVYSFYILKRLHAVRGAPYSTVNNIVITGRHMMCTFPTKYTE
jgi:hypothetical protein